MRRSICRSASTCTGLPRREQLPVGVVHRLAGEHHRRFGSQMVGVRGDAVAAHPQPPVIDVAAVKQVQLMGFRIAQRPHVGRGTQQHVDREDRNGLGEPVDRVDDSDADIAAVPPDAGGDQREDPLRVRVTLHQIIDAELAQPRVDDVEARHHAVVREDPVVLQKWVGVAQFQGRAGRVADVCDERRTRNLVCFGRELAVLPRGDRLSVRGPAYRRPQTPRARCRRDCACSARRDCRAPRAAKRSRSPPAGRRADRTADT